MVIFAQDTDTREAKINQRRIIISFDSSSDVIINGKRQWTRVIEIGKELGKEEEN